MLLVLTCLKISICPSAPQLMESRNIQQYSQDRYYKALLRKNEILETPGLWGNLNAVILHSFLIVSLFLLLTRQHMD